MQSFQEIAQIFDHDLLQLEAGEEITSFVKIPSMEAGRYILSRADNNMRKKRSEVFYQGIEKRQRLFQGKHDRGEEYVFADGKVHADDVQNINSHLPLHSKLVSIKTKIVKANEVWDLTLPYDYWGFGPREELYVAVNVDTLILEPNAQVIIQGNIFSLCCQKVIRLGSNTSSIDGAFDIGVLPTTMPVDNRTGPIDGANGQAGADGWDGTPGQHHGYTSTMFGPQPDSNKTSLSPEAGKNALDGKNGRPGVFGRIGTMVKLAELTIGELENFADMPLSIYSKPGDGGAGGDGGDGGAGGDGGDGGNGIRTDQQQLDPCFGGHGGNGGRGGRGGHGGNGGIASNIFVATKSENLSQIQVTSLPCNGGKQGIGGQGGRAGSGGTGGILQNTSTPLKATDGLTGLAGDDGRNGSNGRSRPGPNIFVYSFEQATELPQLASKSVQTEVFV